MKALGIGLIALPFVLIILCGLIFDTADFLVGMGIFALIAAPILLGTYLLARFTP